MASQPRLFKASQALKAKVGSGGLPPGVLERATRAVETLTRTVDFGAETRDVMIALSAFMAQAEAQPSNCAAPLSRVFEIAHELRGEAGTFEFPMVTRIAASLCRFTTERDRLSVRQLRIARVHVDAMIRVIKDNVRGNEDRLAQQIIRGLEYLVHRDQTRTAEA